MSDKKNDNREYNMKELFEDIPIPDEISPENIAEMLKNSQQNKPQIVLSQKTPKKAHRHISKKARVFTSIAACALILIGVAAAIRSDRKLFSDVKSSSYGFKTELSEAKDYSQVFEAIQKISVSAQKYERTAILEDTVPNENMSTSTNNTNSNFSTTHEQVEGVAEADTAKTDGKNIFYISAGKFYIVDTNNGSMKILSKTGDDKNFYCEFFLIDKKVILISQNTPDKAAILADSSITSDMIIRSHDTKVEVMDISDPTKPTVVSTYKQNGSYISARMIGNNLYLVTNYMNYINGTLKDKNDYKSYVPSYSVGDKQELIKPEDINIPAEAGTTSYTIVSGLDVTATNPLVSIKAMLGYSGTVYCSKDSIYIVGEKWDEQSISSAIAKLALDSGKLKHTAFGTVSGTVVNQFSMDEYNGNFRIATTIYDAKGNHTSGLYVLDKDLKTIGKVTGLAPTETIHSVRFDGTMAYVVTFKQTDPLFAIDVSKPTSPKVVKELKINGYSSYLAKYGDGKLVGFGVDADDKGARTGLKLTMFKTADNGNVSELNTVKLGEDLKTASSPALYDHKAILIDSEKNLIGVPVEFFDGIDTCNRYYLLSYSETDGFKIIGKTETHDLSYLYTFNRGMYIGDVVYAFSDGRIIASKTKDMSLISAIDFIDPTTTLGTTHKNTLVD